MYVWSEGDEQNKDTLLLRAAWGVSVKCYIERGTGCTGSTSARGKVSISSACVQK